MGLLFPREMEVHGKDRFSDSAKKDKEEPELQKLIDKRRELQEELLKTTIIGGREFPAEKVYIVPDDNIRWKALIEDESLYEELTDLFKAYSEKRFPRFGFYLAVGAYPDHEAKIDKPKTTLNGRLYQANENLLLMDDMILSLYGKEISRFRSCITLAQDDKPLLPDLGFDSDLFKKGKNYIFFGGIQKIDGLGADQFYDALKLTPAEEEFFYRYFTLDFVMDQLRQNLDLKSKMTTDSSEISADW